MRGNTLFTIDEMSCPTNEPDVDFFVLRTPKIDENIRNPRIFLRKMAACSCLAGPIDIRIHASMYFMSICPLTHIIMAGAKYIYCFLRCCVMDFAAVWAVAREKHLCNRRLTDFQAQLVVVNCVLC